MVRQSKYYQRQKWPEHLFFPALEGSGTEAAVPPPARKVVPTKIFLPTEKESQQYAVKYAHYKKIYPMLSSFNKEIKVWPAQFLGNL